MGGLLGGRVWRYDLSPADGGTLVHETCATLERIAQLLES
jgi:hypothetical protein